MLSFAIMAGVAYSEGEVKTPENAENLVQSEAAGNKVVNYVTKSDVETAFAAQAKLVKDAGWKNDYAGMTDPIKAAGTITQTFTLGKKILSLSVTTDPVNAGMSNVSMTQADNPMAQ